MRNDDNDPPPHIQHVLALLDFNWRTPAEHLNWSRSLRLALGTMTDAYQGEVIFRERLQLLLKAEGENMAWNLARINDQAQRATELSKPWAWFEALQDIQDMVHVMRTKLDV